MEYNLSQMLSQSHAEQDLVPPPPYKHKRSVQSPMRLWVPVWSLVIIALVVSTWYVGFKWWYILVVLATYLMFYRDYYRWHNRLKCDPDDGILRIEDRAHPFVLFFINGSTDDQIPLDAIALDTPTRTFLDRWVFHCHTLVAGDRKIRDVKNVAHLQAIKKYRDSLKKHSVVLDKQQVDISFAILQTLEAMGRDLRELLGLARQGQSAPTAPTLVSDPDVTESIEPVSPETDGEDPSKV